MEEFIEYLECKVEVERGEGLYSYNISFSQLVSSSSLSLPFILFLSRLHLGSEPNNLLEINNMDNIKQIIDQYTQRACLKKSLQLFVCFYKGP